MQSWNVSEVISPSQSRRKENGSSECSFLLSQSQVTKLIGCFTAQGE